MSVIYYVCTILLLWINLAGLTLYCSRWVPIYALARVAGLLWICTLSFFAEHFIGFGRLNWLWPLTTGLALMVLYRQRQSVNMPLFWRSEGLFWAAFGYGLAWKWAFPLIYPTSERITDLYFIGNYLSGTTLPPLDNWFPPHRFNFYYSFQHYAAALMGRILGLSPGLTYNLAFALLMALPNTLAWAFTANWLKSKWQRILVVATFVIGGTGATPFVHLSYTLPTEFNAQQRAYAASDAMWASQRFIGSFDQRLNTPLGQQWFPKQAKPGWEPRELPLEDFGYQFYVGDYHPPLGGFLLLLVGLACISNLERLYNLPLAATTTQNANVFNLQALLAFTVPLMVATNTWTFPLQGALVLGWIIWRYIHACPPCWKALLLGGSTGFLLLYPFLSGFAGNALPTPIKWIQAADHTPLVGFLALHWPLLLFGLLSLFAQGTRRLALLFTTVFLGLLVISECIYIDDLSGDKFERTNTVMKWWGWIWSGGLVTLATLLLASRPLWIKGLVVSSLLVINLYALDVVRYWALTDKSAAGKLAGHSVYTQDAVAREMFKFLDNAASGIVLENNYGNSFTDAGVYAAFASMPTLLGWPLHLTTWHGNLTQVWILKEQIIQFYKGQLPDAAHWLQGNHVDYIVWNARDAMTVKAWENIQLSIQQDYAWREFNLNGNPHVGLWVRRSVID